jgi:hypothetical protein
VGTLNKKFIFDNEESEAGGEEELTGIWSAVFDLLGTEECFAKAFNANPLPVLVSDKIREMLDE